MNLLIAILDITSYSHIKTSDIKSPCLATNLDPSERLLSAVAVVRVEFLDLALLLVMARLVPCVSELQVVPAPLATPLLSPLDLHLLPSGLGVAAPE